MPLTPRNPNVAIKELIAQSPSITEAYDTTTSVFEAYTELIDAWYQNQPLAYSQTDKLARQYGADAMSFRIALKIVESWRIMRNLETPVTITLLNPVYKETGRMQRREEHPHGENSIRYKVEALRRLERLSTNLEARFVVIDDECPHNSGQMAQEILKEYAEDNDKSKYRVLFLRDAIDNHDPDAPPNLTHKSGANGSVKGGALLYGMRKIVNDEVKGLHILIDNDADLSVHPAQVGILIEDILTGKVQAVAGSRREPDSVAFVGGSRNKRGKLFIKIWQHLLPQLAQQIVDTNRGFKAFTTEALQKILDSIQIYTFPYQIELLVACLYHGVRLSKRGVAYVDSEAASTQQGAQLTQTYLDQILQIVNISQRYQTIDQHDKVVQFFRALSEEAWREIEMNPQRFLAEYLSETA